MIHLDNTHQTYRNNRRLNITRRTTRTLAIRSLSTRFKKTGLVIAGCGQVGMQLLQRTYACHFIATLRPSPEAAYRKQQIRACGAQAIQVDLHSPNALARLAALSNRVIWMAAPASQGPGTQALRRLSLQLAYRAQAWGRHTPVLTYISTTGVYGNQQGLWVNELTPRNAESARALRRVFDENQLFEASKALRARVQVLRAPGIYGSTRLPVERLVNRLPALLPADDAWSNHIHEVDLARLAYWAQWQADARCVLNACDQHPMKMGDYFDAVADWAGLDRPTRHTAERVQSMVSPMMWSFMRESRKIQSIRLQSVPWGLCFPTVQRCLDQLNPRQVLPLYGIQVP